MKLFIFIFAFCFLLSAFAQDDFERLATVRQASAAASDSTTNGLIAWWKFEEGSGDTTTDSSGNSKTGYLTNSPAWTAGHVGSYALTFYGTNQVGFGTTDVGTTHSLSCWLNLSARNDETIVSHIAYNNGGYLGYIDATKFWYAGNGQLVSVTTGTLPSATWFHLAVVRSGTSVSFYTNGVQCATTQTLGANDATTVSTIGANTAAASGLNGAIDDVRLYNRALTGAEITTLAGM